MDMTKYNNPKWLLLRKRILNRDNYSCQVQGCNAFNPKLGVVTILCDDGSAEAHQYYDLYADEPALSSQSKFVYAIDSGGYGRRFVIDFGDVELILPSLHIHHKFYVKGKEPWDYDDDVFLAVCGRCHNLIHQNLEIPILDSTGNKIFKSITPDKELIYVEEFEPWRFVAYNAEGVKDYVQTVYPKIDVETFLFGGGADLDCSDEKLKAEADRIVKSFMTRFTKYIK